MGRLTDILGDSHDGDQLRRAWDDTEAADEFKPLPRGEYTARITKGELTTSRRNATPSYKLTFRVLEGEHAGRQFWTDIWLTPQALPMAKRDLAKLGVTQLEQLEQPLPPRIRCSVQLALRKDDDGSEYNHVRRFDVLGVDPPDRDTFAPNDYDDCDASELVDATAEPADEEAAELSDDAEKMPF